MEALAEWLRGLASALEWTGIDGINREIAERISDVACLLPASFVQMQTGFAARDFRADDIVFAVANEDERRHLVVCTALSVVGA